MPFERKASESKHERYRNVCPNGASSLQLPCPHTLRMAARGYSRLRVNNALGPAISQRLPREEVTRDDQRRYGQIRQIRWGFETKVWRRREASIEEARLCELRPYRGVPRDPK